MQIFMYLFTGAFLTVMTPLVAIEIKESIETDRELKEKGLL